MFRYEDLLAASHRLASALLDGRSDLAEAPLALMVPPGFDYVHTQWAIWRAGGIAVPLCLSHPPPALRYVLEDTNSAILVISPEREAEFTELARQSSIRLVVLSSESPPPPEIPAGSTVSRSKHRSSLTGLRATDAEAPPP